MLSSPRHIVVTSQDMTRLTDLIDTYADGQQRVAALALDEELARAQTVEPAKVQANVITMNSKVRYLDVRTGRERVIVLAYPHDASVDEGRISVLTPVGVALLGLEVGQRFAFSTAGGVKQELEVLEILYQPEAAGDFEL